MGTGKQYCGHNEDVSVPCTSVSTQMRLVGSAREGRLEVFYNGAWGTVCGRSFSTTSAKVACNGLGFGHVGHVMENVHTPGSGPIWLDNVQCTGCAAGLNQCRHRGWGVHNCTHSDDVSIACYDGTTDAAPTAISFTAATTSEQTTEQLPESATQKSGSGLISESTLIVIVSVCAVVLLLIVVAIVICIICIIRRNPRESRADARDRDAVGLPEILPPAGRNNDAHGRSRNPYEPPVVGAAAGYGNDGQKHDDYSMPGDYEFPNREYEPIRFH